MHTIVILHARYSYITCTISWYNMHDTMILHTRYHDITCTIPWYFMHDTMIQHTWYHNITRHHDITYTIKFKKMYSVSNATIVFFYLIAKVIGFCFTIAFCSCMHVLACKTFMYHLNKIKLKWRICVFPCLVCCSLFHALMSSLTLHLIVVIVKFYQIICSAGVGLS